MKKRVMATGGALALLLALLIGMTQPQPRYDIRVTSGGPPQTQRP